jgi:outer membrane beta-barrel protein
LGIKKFLLPALYFGVAMTLAWSTYAKQNPSSNHETGIQDEIIEVEKLKQKYWASGDESEIGVVQNRLYSKARRFHLGVSGGVIINDPFLSTKSYGVSTGYHFSEFIGFNLMGWRTPTGKSSALDAFEAPPRTGAQANTNPPKSYLGAELTFSPIYGKLSVLGKSILYYDFHILVGAGVTKTETGNYSTGHLGLGQRFYLNKHFNIRVDYRSMVYKETIKEKVIAAKLGEPVGQRTAWNHSISFGLEWMFGSVK